MDIAKRKNELIRFGVDPSEMHVIRRNGTLEDLLIIKRTGIDKIEAYKKISCRYVSVTESSYANGCNVTVVVEACDYDGNSVQALGSANPDTMPAYNKSRWYISDLASKRARHKAIIKLTGLTQHNVYSEDEAEEFTFVRKSTEPIIKEALSKMK